MLRTCYRLVSNTTGKSRQVRGNWCNGFWPYMSAFGVIKDDDDNDDYKEAVVNRDGLIGRTCEFW